MSSFIVVNVSLVWLWSSNLAANGSDIGDGRAIEALPFG